MSRVRFPTLVLMPCLIFITALFLPCMAYAAEGHSTTSKRHALLGLAQKFVNTVNDGFDFADEYWSELRPDDIRSQDFFALMPDGELLILEVRLGRDKLPSPILAVKQGRDVMISMTDLAIAADFPLNVKPLDGLVEGWFIREDQEFFLDTNNMVAQVKGESYQVKPEDIMVEPDDILVRGRILSQWTGFNFTVNMSQQYVDVVSEQKWPFQERQERDYRIEQRRQRIGRPQLPRQKDPYKLISVPNVDVFTRSSYINEGPAAGDETRKSQTYTVQAGGDIAGHTGYALLNGSDEETISSGRFFLSKESEDPDLLGPLKARSYLFGDILPTRVPFAGGSGSEVGFSVTNKDPLSTLNTFTEITGQAFPEWDIELFRDTQLLDIVAADDVGFYEFNDVALFGGLNTFRVVMYGPQGEVREETRTINVDTDTYSEGAGIYDVSLSLPTTEVWQKHDRDDPDRDTPHLAATYERQIMQDLIGRAGIRSRQEDGEDKFYLQGGATAFYKDIILNADAVMEDDGAYKGAVSARHNFGKHNAILSAEYASKNYNPGSNNRKPSELILESRVRGKLPFNIGRRPDYSFGTRYIEDGDGATQLIEDASFSTRLTRRLGVGTSARRTTTEDDSGKETRFTGRSFIRGNIKGVNWRATGQYEIEPETKMTAYELLLSKRLKKNLDSSLEINHEVNTDFTSAEVGLNWLGENITVTPTLTYDTDDTFSALLSTRFGLSYDPYGNNLEMFGRRLSTRGGVSAHVFLDHDGDNTFTEGVDENLEGILVEALQARRSAVSDENGNAFIFEIQPERPTDVIVAQESLFDPYTVPGFEGVSVKARDGHVQRIEFPIHMAGEIDGVVYTVKPDGKKRPIRNMTVYLYDEEGRVAFSSPTAADGYYFITRIPPGRYYLALDKQMAENFRLIRPKIEEIVIGYDGPVLAGKDIVLKAGEDDLPVEILADMRSYTERHPHIDFSSLEDSTLILNLGSYRSRLMMAVTWYKLASRYQAYIGDAELLVPPSQSYGSLETGQHDLRVELPPESSLDEAYRRCRVLSARGIYCAVEFLPSSEQKMASAQ